MARQRGPDMTEDDPVTIRDIYTQLQQLNERSVQLVQQVGTLTERAQEDRNRMVEIANDIQKLKIKVYSIAAAIILFSTLTTVLDKVTQASQNLGH